MNKNFENLTQELSTEIIDIQKSKIDYEILEDIEKIISINWGVNYWIKDFKKFSEDIKNYIETLPENIAKDLNNISNIVISILNFEEKTEQIEEFIIPENIQF